MNNNNKKALLALSLISMVAACAPSGYYDSTGVYHSYGQSDVYSNEKPMGKSASEQVYSPTPKTTVIYQQPETDYYDYRTPSDYNTANVPPSMLPPTGMCRVWFADNRRMSQEPPVESCNGIKERAPEGSFVIYGK